VDQSDESRSLRPRLRSAEEESWLTWDEPRSLVSIGKTEGLAFLGSRAPDCAPFDFAKVLVAEVTE
jgi:hypothetical protein